jgi:hypothetical protein
MRLGIHLLSIYTHSHTDCLRSHMILGRRPHSPHFARVACIEVGPERTSVLVFHHRTDHMTLPSEEKACHLCASVYTSTLA